MEIQVPFWFRSGHVFVAWALACVGYAVKDFFAGKQGKYEDEASRDALAPGFFIRGIRELTHPGSPISTHFSFAEHLPKNPSRRCRARRNKLAVAFATAMIIANVVCGDDRLPERIDFNRDVRPILSDVCFHCHGPDPAKRKADLRFDTDKGAFADLGDRRKAIIPGKPDSSELIKRIESTDPDLQMPPPEVERHLSARQIAILKRWIEQGAKWDAHWSFVKPARTDPPVVQAAAWGRSPLDRFILAKLEQHDLAPSAEAEKSTLLRRVTLDLTGLPPTPGDVADFLVDESPDAFERVIDRLLATPRYGERMAIRWLNAARYADTSGYQSDGERTMWRWRDWVIDAFNANMSFDQFTIEQLAGDLMPNPSLEHRLATGFNRNHRGNAEGGIIPEEFAVEYVVDRTETTATVWLGLTAMCARCHNHKYDPITQSDFYQLYAFFNNVPEKGRAVKFGNSAPMLLTPTREQQQELDRLDRGLMESEAAWANIMPDVATSQRDWERGRVPDLLAAEAVRHRLILHFPLDGQAIAAVSIPFQAARPTGYLGQTPLLATPSSDRSGVPPETGNPQFAPGRFGQALEADGQHYAAVGDVANFGFFDKFSVSAWLRPNGEAGGTIVSRMTDVPHGDGWGVVLERGKLQVHLTKRWLDDASRVETENAISVDGWHHVTVTYDGSRENKGISIFVDGVRQQTVSLLDELNQSFDNKGVLRIGAGNGPEGRFHGLIDDVRIFDRVVTDDESAILAETGRMSEIAALTPEARTPRQEATLRTYFTQQQAGPESICSTWLRLQSLREARAKFWEELPTTMIMEDLPTPRASHVLIRGEYDKRGDQVSAGVPASLPPMPAHSPRNRLGLALWLVDRDHPLTSRVAVNRLWQMLFGTGIVKTVDDFGQQGEWPSHLELLDWLAVEFQSPTALDAQPGDVGTRPQWDIKRMLRLIATSSTYRQSSRTSALLQQRDPENRLLARGPRFRLSAEMVRDQALAASGLLVERLGGPSIKPYQPDGLWKDLANLDYIQDHGPNLYRRSLYIYWKRTVAPPFMVTFDAAGRETCIVKETRTNTPLQALNLMNDVAYVEAARLLAEHLLSDTRLTVTGRISRAFELVLGRPARPQELSVLTQGFERHLAYFQAHPSSAESLASAGEFPRETSLDVCELAAYSTIAGLILNLDEAVTCE